MSSIQNGFYSNRHSKRHLLKKAFVTCREGLGDLTGALLGSWVQRRQVQNNSVTKGFIESSFTGCRMVALGLGLSLRSNSKDSIKSTLTHTARAFKRI